MLVGHVIVHFALPAADVVHVNDAGKLAAVFKLSGCVRAVFKFFRRKMNGFLLITYHFVAFLERGLGGTILWPP